MKKTVFVNLFVLVSIILFQTSRAADIPRAPLPQGLSPIAQFGQHVGRLNPATPIQIVVILQLQNEDGLNALIAGQNNPKSPYYRQFISPDQFTQNFSPSVASYNAVVSYFQGLGFQVETTPNRQLVLASGSANQVERAFATELHSYNYQGQLHYANLTPASLPAPLVQVVKAVQGLDSRQLFSHSQERPGSGALSTPSGYGPNTIAKAYDFPKLYSWNGKGRTLAVATAYNFRDTDIQKFDSTYGIAIGGYTRVWVKGSTGSTNAETALDVEYSTALANGAFEYVYSVPIPYLSYFTTMFNKIVTDNFADAVTSSWGLCEQSTGTFTIGQDDGIIKQGVAQGQSWFFASGDSGSYDCGGSTLAVDYPSSTPYATACGGTTLILSNTGSIQSETAWSGSGGGTSVYEKLPSWETGSSYFGNGMRWNADYSMDADPNTGMAVMYNGSWRIYGGTSFVAPFSVALATSIVQYKNSRLGIFAARLDQLATSGAYANHILHDITAGSNGAYSAGVGWDPPSGWGSPDGYMLLLNY